ncbi:DUF2635 domain-containing protein [Pandoraea apista]|uniref:DUF2635 domain-containing protein n=1 Tax=Pandoraea apista TaxID=93218 RepID=UPI000F66C008|nr:DUF2635 domain-containing protein [Pandoraea apista]RRW89149.1 DUF2635 domain-containing protein [Pandoraea apista]RRW98943.1 DUF2635 domain-containing protein [Pandoraea apista]
MKVIARDGLRVPKEFAAREYITDAQAQDVPDTAYYHRRVAEGDLIVRDAVPAAPVDPSAAKISSKPAKGA